MAISDLNPFTNVDFIKSAQSAKGLNGLVSPEFGIDALTAMYDKNLEMMTAANKTMLDTINAMGLNQIELMRKSFEQTTGFMNNIMSLTALQGESTLTKAKTNETGKEPKPFKS